MTDEELRQRLMTRIDALLGRVFVVFGEDRRLLSALRGYVAVMPDSELSKINSYMVRAEQSPPTEGESEMAKKEAKSSDPNAQPYKDHCVDCIQLPTQFPHTCLSVVVDALGGDVPDPECAVHCSYTLIGWGLGLWIIDHNPPGPPAPSFGANDTAGQRKWAAEQLSGLLPKGATAKGAAGAVTVDETAAKALPWMSIALIILDLIKQYLVSRDG
jgi:hypothetical protein